MVAVTLNLYDKFREHSFDGGAVNFETPGGNGIKAALVTAAYTVDQNLHDFFDDVSANEVSGTGYTAGGNVMANGAVTISGAGLVTVDLDDPAVWTQDAGGFTNARRVIVYRDSTVAATSEVIAFSNDFGADKGNVDGDFSATVNAAGLYTAPR